MLTNTISTPRQADRYYRPEPRSAAIRGIPRGRDQIHILRIQSGSGHRAPRTESARPRRRETGVPANPVAHRYAGNCCDRQNIRRRVAPRNLQSVRCYNQLKTRNYRDRPIAPTHRSIHAARDQRLRRRTSIPRKPLRPGATANRRFDISQYKQGGSHRRLTEFSGCFGDNGQCVQFA